ncbi:hypothetical protein ACFV3E_24650 [Streptomyces sp. NPDC059718]
MPDTRDDWWDRLYADDDQEQDDQPAAEPWYRLKRRGSDPEQPEQAPVTIDQGGILITIAQPKTPPARARVRRRVHPMWLVYNGGAAFAGWTLGLEPAMAAAINGAGLRGGLAFGVGLVIVTAIPAVYVRGLRVNDALRPVAVWVARIPVASAALALALHTTGRS